jgi:MFS family permease
MGTGATFLLLSLAGFAIGANLRVTDPLLPTFAIEFGTTVGAAAIVATVFSFAHGALQLVYGPLGDRLGKLRIVAYAAIASALISAATAFADSLTSLATLRLFCGFATAAIVPLSLAFVGDTTSYNDRHAALARYTGTVMLGLIAGQVLGGGRRRCARFSVDAGVSPAGREWQRLRGDVRVVPAAVRPLRAGRRLRTGRDQLHHSGLHRRALA